MRIFPWMGTVSSGKMVTVPWRVVCVSTNEGVLNIKRPVSFTNILLCKLAFKFTAFDSIVYSFFRSQLPASWFYD